MSDMKVGRFAPSPTGRMHLGNVFAYLMAWLAARSTGGRILLIIEDLDDRARPTEYTDCLLSDLEWLGLTWDGEPVRQTLRGELYEEALARLANAGLTYPCFCTRADLHAASAPHASDGTYVYAGTCRNLSPAEIDHRSAGRAPAMRLRVPDADDPATTIAVHDEVYGGFFENLARECGDFIVRRSDGVFAYQLAAVVDDAAMGVTQVVRGRDLLGSCARQMYLQDALGLPHVEYLHVPLLVAPDGRRLSKRDRDLDTANLREQFVSPEPILGRLAALVGFCEPGNELSAEELVPLFNLDALRAHRDDIPVYDAFPEVVP